MSNNMFEEVHDQQRRVLRGRLVDPEGKGRHLYRWTEPSVGKGGDRVFVARTVTVHLEREGDAGRWSIVAVFTEGQRRRKDGTVSESQWCNQQWWRRRDYALSQGAPQWVVEAVQALHGRVGVKV